MPFTNLSLSQELNVKPVIASSTTVTYQGITINSATVGVNGLDAGTLAAFKPYFIHNIISGGAPALLASLSKTAPTLPSGVTTFKWSGWVFVPNDVLTITNIEKDTNWTEIACTPTVTGIPTSSRIFTMKRSGRNMILEGTIVASGAGSGSIVLTLPGGLIMDATAISGVGSQGGAAGYNGSNFIGVPSTNSSTTIVFVTGNGGSSVWNTTTPFTWANGNQLGFFYIAPIAAWSSTDI